MNDQSVIPEPIPVSPAAARTALHRIIERLTDEEVIGLWTLFSTWGGARGAPDRQQGEA